jgi:hypothetical protein
MQVGSLTGKKRAREPADEPPGGEPAARIAKKARQQAKETCAAFPDLNTVEGQDAFFNLVGIEGIEQCFRDDLKTVEQVYWQKVDAHAAADCAGTVRPPPVRVDPRYFADAQTRRVPGDGDCAFHSMIAGARPLGGSTAAAVPSTPLEMRRQMAAHVEREYAAWHHMPVHDVPNEKQYLLTLPSDGDERRAMLQDLRTSGSWFHETGDLYIAIAADTFGLQIEVITPYTDREHQQVFGVPRRGTLPLVLRRERAHYEPVIRRSAVQHRQHIRPELALVQHIHHAGRREHEDQRREEPGHRGE